MPVCDPVGVDATTLYRRRQRRRAVIAWGTFVIIAALVAAVIAFGGEEEDSGSKPVVHLFSWEMSSSQYEQLHKGEAEPAVLKEIGTAGIQEDEVQETDLLEAFPPPPPEASCSFWKLSDAPDHLVRLCFGETEAVLLRKSVRAPDESGAETTLA
jgi:hypothetical protein